MAALGRAFLILEAFRLGEDGLSLAEIARRTGLYKSTILRLLVSLEEAGFTRRLPDGRYSIGPEPLRLAQIYQDSFRIRHVVYPILQNLCAETGETASMYVRQNNSRVVLYRIEPDIALRFSIREGERYPLDAGASSKIFLAFSEPYAKKSGLTRERLWSVSYGERVPGTASVSTPIFGVTQDLQGVFSISGPRDRFSDQDMKAACRSLLKASARASAALGGDASVFRRSLALLENQNFPPDTY